MIFTTNAHSEVTAQATVVILRAIRVSSPFHLSRAAILLKSKNDFVVSCRDGRVARAETNGRGRKMEL